MREQGSGSSQYGKVEVDGNARRDDVQGLDVVDHTSGRTGSGSVGVGGGVGGSHCCYFFRG